MRIDVVCKGVDDCGARLVQKLLGVPVALLALLEVRFRSRGIEGLVELRARKPRLVVLGGRGVGMVSIMSAVARAVRSDMKNSSFIQMFDQHPSDSARFNRHNAHLEPGARVDRNHAPEAGVTSKLPFQPNPFDHATACKGANEIFSKTA